MFLDRRDTDEGSLEKYWEMNKYIVDVGPFMGLDHNKQAEYFQLYSLFCSTTW